MAAATAGRYARLKAGSWTWYERAAGLAVPATSLVVSGMAEEDADPELEFSPLSGTVTRDGVTVIVQIYRLAGGSDGWSLEVIDHEQASTVWDHLFATDGEAYAEFYRTLEVEGIRSFAERPPGRPH